jgi:serine/threonine-protein kinase
VDSLKTWLAVIALLALLSAILAFIAPTAGTLLALAAATLAVGLAWRAQARVRILNSRLRSNPRGGSSPANSEAKPAEAPALPELSAYERLEKIAEGTMGELWLVRHRQLERIAALKEIKGSEVDAEDIKRFTREAQVLSTLRCPHTIDVYDFGVGATGYPYYVMEYLEGVNLQTLVDQQGPLAIARVIHVLSQVCLSLEEAHEAHLVHRDVKPANIMLCHYGTTWDFVKLLDFGLVKQERRLGSASVTRDSVVLGTPAYVAPESLKGSKFVDGRADLYALGAIGFFLLTGRLLFDHKQPVAMAKAHLLEPAPRASRHVSLPPALDELLDDCLKKEPEARPQSAGEVLRRLGCVEGVVPWTQEQARICWESDGLPTPRTRSLPQRK